MIKKKLILGSASGVLALSLIAGVATLGDGSQRMARAANDHNTHTSALKEIGFDWKDPTKDGFQPYWRCEACCEKDPASSRFSDQAGATPVTADSLRLAALSSVQKTDITNDEIANLDSSSVLNTDQNVKDDKNNDSVAEYYVSSGDHKAIYFSRSGITGEGNGKETEFLFATSAKNVGSVTFSYCYKNWNETSTVQGRFAYASGDSTASDSAAITLVNDGAWNTVTINYSDIVSGGSARANFTGFGLKFSDLRGYIMISSLSYSHGHVYNDDHICPDDGYSDPGKLAVDLDGDLGDAKWASYDKASSLFDLKSDGRGIKVKGFTSGDYAYFGFEIIHKTDAFNNAEIIFNGTNSTDTTAYIDQSGNTRWGGNFAGAVAKTSKLASGLYSTVVEIASKLSVVAPSGNLTAAFGAAVTGEDSESSYKDATTYKPEYWVLKGLNPWGGAGSAFAVDADGIHHTHSYQDGKCVWCDEAAPTAAYAIEPDGDASDWDSEIAKKSIGTSDDEGRYFGWNAFTDDTYLYLTSTLIHKSSHLASLAMLGAAKSGVEVTIASFSETDLTYSFSGDGLVKGGYKVSTDDESGLTTTVFEFVITKSTWTVDNAINIGLLAYTNDSSAHFDINHSEAPGYWGITYAHNSWGSGGWFSVTSNGVAHTHAYSSGKCYLCGETQAALSPAPAVTIDGDISDFADVAKDTKLESSDSTTGEGISLIGYTDDNYAYLGIEVKTASYSVSIVDVCGKAWATAYYPFKVAGGIVYCDGARSICASKYSYDSNSKLYSYTFEIAILKSAFTVENDGSVKIGFNVGGCSKNANLICDPNNLVYWAVKGYNCWAGEGSCFIFSSNGVALPSVAS